MTATKTRVKIIIDGDEQLLQGFPYSQASIQQPVYHRPIAANSRQHPVTWAAIATILGAGAILNIPAASNFWDSLPPVKAWQQQIANLTGNPIEISSSESVNREAIAQTALKQVGTHFNKGQIAQCAFFVRSVLESFGIDLPVTQQPIDKIRESAKGVAASMAGPDIGTPIYNTKDLKPGDLVFFADTYGNWPKGTITHVGIYTGNGMMVDRGTHTAPVNHRPISIFTFKVGIRIADKYLKKNSLKVNSAFLRPIRLGEKIGDLQVKERGYFPCQKADKSDCTLHPINKDKKNNPLLGAHRGIDLGAPKGRQQFVAGSKGPVQVECKSEPGGAGTYAVITPTEPKNTVFRSFHLFSCNPGTYQLGQVFGRTGSTGLSTKPHWHWEQKVLINGVWVYIHPQLAWLYQSVTGRLPQ